MPERTDPLQAFNFILQFEIPGGIKGRDQEIHFQRVTGLEESIEVAEYREGGSRKLVVDKLPGLVTVSNITLERGLAVSSDANTNALMLWFQAYGLLSPSSVITAIDVFNAQKPTDMDLYIFNRTGAILGSDRIDAQKHIRILQAFPVRIALGDFDATSNDVVIETLELACEGWYYA